MPFPPHQCARAAVANNPDLGLRQQVFVARKSEIKVRLRGRFCSRLLSQVLLAADRPRCPWARGYISILAFIVTWLSSLSVSVSSPLLRGHWSLDSELMLNPG